MRTFVGMTLRPGKTALRYVRGERETFAHPALYIALAAPLPILVVSLANPADRITFLIAVQSGLISLFHVLLMSGAFMVAFRGSRFTFPDYVTLFLFVIGQEFLWGTLLGIVPISEKLQIQISMGIVVIYPSWAVWSFHEGTVRFRALRILGVWVGLASLVVVPILWWLIFDFPG